MPSFLQETLTALHGTAFDTPARQRTLRVTQVSWRAPDGSHLVPDAAISVMGAQPRLWPPLIVEVANTQSYESATAKIARWFTTSEGSVEVALLMKFTAPDAMVDPVCFVEVWRSRAGQEALGSELVGDVGDPESPAEDGASAVGTSSDEETADDLALGTDGHPDAAYGLSSSAITIYRDGPRRIVYPALEPPAVRTSISLRYSDFFGTENVPAGRDPGEVVLLDLEVLREVLVEFVDLTRAQVARIKGKREGEDEPVVEVSVEEDADEKDEAVQQNTAGGKRVRR